MRVCAEREGVWVVRKARGCSVCCRSRLGSATLCGAGGCGVPPTLSSASDALGCSVEAGGRGRGEGRVPDRARGGMLFGDGGRALGRESRGRSQREQGDGDRGWGLGDAPHGVGSGASVMHKGMLGGVLGSLTEAVPAHPCSLPCSWGGVGVLACPAGGDQC